MRKLEPKDAAMVSQQEGWIRIQLLIQHATVLHAPPSTPLPSNACTFPLPVCPPYFLHHSNEKEAAIGKAEWKTAPWYGTSPLWAPHRAIEMASLGLCLCYVTNLMLSTMHQWHTFSLR